MIQFQQNAVQCWHYSFDALFELSSESTADTKALSRAEKTRVFGDQIGEHPVRCPNCEADLIL